jgi:Endonuclease/Exonuclease/phosphatase family
VVSRLATRLNSQLPGRGYHVVHADTRDERGIDVAFLFDPNFFTAPANERFQHVVMRRTATREIFQVNFQTHRGRTWSILGNHRPSRSGGPPIESAGYRAIAGETQPTSTSGSWRSTEPTACPGHGGLQRRTV